MPMVSAAGYPTQETPTVSPSPTPGPDYQSIPAATPNAFGAQVGVAQERLGSAFEQAGTGLAQAAVQRQELTNQVAANQATNYAMDEVMKILHGDPNKPGDVGFYGLKGIDAVNARQGTARSLDDIISKTRGTLSNARQQLSFDNETRRMRNYWMGEIGRHYDQQLTQSAINTAVAGEKMGYQGMASTAAGQDQAGFSLQVENTMKRVYDQAEAGGWTQTQIDERLGEVRSDATKMWVSSMGEKDPAGALRFLESNKDALRPGEYPALINQLRVKAQKQVTHQDIYGGTQTPHGLVRGGAAGAAVQYGAAGPHAVEAVGEFKKAGWSDAAIQGVLANGQNEGGFEKSWKKAEGGENSFGHWQFNANGELPGFQSAFGNDRSTAAQAKYVIQRMEQIHPGFGKIQDPKQAADIMEREFERPAQITGNRYQGPISVGGDAQVASGIDMPPYGRKDVPITDPRYDSMEPRDIRPGESQKHYIDRLDAMNAQEKGGAPDTAAPTQTGAQATPVAAGLADQLLASIPHEDGQLPDTQVPGLMGAVSEAFKKIGDDPGPYQSVEERKAAAVKQLRSQMNAAYADQRHQHTLDQEAIKQADQNLMMEYNKRLASPNPPTALDVLNDPRWKTPEAQQKMVGFVERETKKDPVAQVSKRTTVDLFERMKRPWGTEGKVTSEDQIDKPYINGQLTRQDHDDLVKKWRDIQTDTGQKIAVQEAELTKAVTARITGLMEMRPVVEAQAEIQSQQTGEPTAKMRMYNFIDNMHRKVESYRAANKDPSDLFNPKKPDFLGSPDAIAPFEAKMPTKMNEGGAVNTKHITQMNSTELRAFAGQNAANWDAARAEIVRRGVLVVPPVPQAPVR